MLLAASESAVTKNPRLRLTTRRSSSVRPRGSFHSAMSRLMLISCGIQWLAHAARYFSQAHLYLNGTSWLTSALELMTSLSSTVTRRNAPAASGSGSLTGAAGTKPLAGCIGRPGIPPSVLSSSKLSMHRPPDGRGHDALQLGVRGLALAFRGVVHLAGGDVEVPLGAGERQPVGVRRVALEHPAVGQVGCVAEVHRVEHQQAPARDHHRVQPGCPRRRPQRREERAGEAAAAQGNHWQASHSGLSMAQNFASSAAASPLPLLTALSCPALLVDFSACVAPIERR